MIVFPHAKINIGLNVIRKREDGFHDIESVFYPINLCDSLEFISSKKTKICTSGLNINTLKSDNIVTKAYNLIKEDYDLPNLSIHLHKVIPFGAGLGGGSSDAAFFIKDLNSFYNLNISKSRLEEYAATLGSDCTFFLQDKPAFVTGRGEKINSINIKLTGYKLLIVKPDIYISTPEAFTGIKPALPKIRINESITKKPETWKDFIYNDFESHIFEKHPKLKLIKSEFYKSGAIYSSMSGSGSTIFGIYKEKPNLDFFKQFGFLHYEEMK
ncbi:MAG: 4-(cytidine 5'-diphospho)-2-C-methyl-D-erythritol kinase [Bacteroidales bacterium]|nr:4-(cytidine 5'-diphospho)-2-C-methyl-D-erythritol kinase [Bacteroidales bacterium]